MRMPDLKSLARDRGLRNYSRMRKAELVALLQNNPPPGQSRASAAPTPRTRPPPPPPPSTQTWEPTDDRRPRKPSPQEMDIFEQQEISKSRPQVKTKLNKSYDWLINHVPKPIKDDVQLDVRTAKSVQTFDFSTLYTSIPHDLLKSRISNLVHNAFRKKDGSVRYTHIKLTRAKGYFTHDINGGGDNMFTADSICEMIEFLIDNIFVQFGGRLFRQVIGIPMGTNCAPLLADLFLYSYENEFLDNMIRSGHRRLARSFNLCYRYIDDLIVFNNKKFLDYLKEIYPSQLTVEKANKSDHLADYLDLTFIIDSGGKLSTRLYDKRDDFDFHIVNFPFLSSNIPSGPSYGVYISQLIRYARCCSHYDDFRYRHKCLVDRLLSQGYKALRLEKSFKKFYGRYQDLIEKYRRSVNAMVSDSFPGQFLFNM